MQQTKSERFEMRLDQHTLDRVDDWRGEQGDMPSRAEAIRRLVDKGLSADKISDQTSFSGPEKLIVYMLCELYTGLKTRTELDPDFIKDALLGGHFWGLEWKHTGIFQRYRDNEEVVNEVVDILDMYSFIEHGYEHLSDEEKQRVKTETEESSHDPVFRGFDANNETSHFGIARFLIEKLDRFSASFGKRDMNSHSPSIDIYRRMLPVFLPMRRNLTGSRLSANQIIAILNERTHPDYRK